LVLLHKSGSQLVEWLSIHKSDFFNPDKKINRQIIKQFGRAAVSMSNMEEYKNLSLLPFEVSVLTAARNNNIFSIN